jgi:uncharacterized membrane protein YedE/YeeE
MVMTEFTPLAGLVGGTLIGLSAVLLMGGYGRIAGASGVFAGLLTLNFNAEFSWRFVFIIGMLIGAAWSGLFFFEVSSLAFNGGPLTTIIAGLLVGVGTVLGSGCTSGHGICGLSRFSKRSLAAACTFMAVAVLTVFVTRHVLGA